MKRGRQHPLFAPRPWCGRSYSARIGAAAKAGRIVVVRRFVGHGAVVTTIAVDVGIEVVTAAERPLRVGGPLVHVADHVEDVKAVGAAAERAGGSDGARHLIQARIVHRLGEIAFAAETREELEQRSGAVRVDAVVVFAFVTVRKLGSRWALTGRDP